MAHLSHLKLIWPSSSDEEEPPQALHGSGGPILASSSRADAGRPQADSGCPELAGSSMMGPGGDEARPRAVQCSGIRELASSTGYEGDDAAAETQLYTEDADLGGDAGGPHALHGIGCPELAGSVRGDVESRAVHGGGPELASGDDGGQRDVHGNGRSELAKTSMGLKGDEWGSARCAWQRSLKTGSL